MRNRAVLTTVIGALLVMVSPQFAGAQYIGANSSTWNNPGSALMSVMIQNSINRQMLEKSLKARQQGAATNTQGAQAGSAQSAQQAQLTPAEMRSRLTFSPANRNVAVEELAKTIGDTAENRAQLVPIFQQYLKAFDDQAKTDRADRYDLGRAAAFFVLVNYVAATGKEANDAQANETEKKFRTTLASSNAFAKMSNAQRQQLYEYLVVLGTLPLAGATQAQQSGNKKEEAAYRQLASALVKTLFGIQVDQMTLTSSGLTMP